MLQLQKRAAAEEAVDLLEQIYFFPQYTLSH